MSRKIVIINQAVNYLTIGYANAFNKRYDKVVLVTGNVHTQGENLDHDIIIKKIIKWSDKNFLRKYLSYFVASFQIYLLCLFKYRDYEIFFISVPPFAYLLNIFLPNKFSMIIWDVYPDILKISGINDSSLLFRMWSELNKFSFKKAYKIYTISEKLAFSISKYIDIGKINIFPIWSILV